MGIKTIAMLSVGGNARVMKMALPLINNGHKVHLVTTKVPPYSDALSSLTIYQNADQLFKAIRGLPFIDVFHAHNEPAWLVTAVKEIWEDRKPVIIDIHDSVVLWGQNGSVDERNNFCLADGVVYVSEPMAKLVSEFYNLKQPSTVLPTYLPEAFLTVDFMQNRHVGGLVFGGGISLPKENPPERDFFAFRDYMDFAREARKTGIEFHIYSPSKDKTKRANYGKVCYLHGPLPLNQYIQNLGSYDWGLAGNLGVHSHWRYGLPNKIFEYLAGSTPIMVLNAEETSRIVEKYGIGITVESVKEMKERWGEHIECRNNVIKCRRALTMERKIFKLEQLYKELTW